MNGKPIVIFTSGDTQTKVNLFQYTTFPGPGMREPIPVMMDLLKFVIAELYPDTITMRRADKLWIEIQEIDEW